jgi:hypothetical protein
MASGFPGSIDNFTDPLSNSPLTSPNHATLHADVNDAVEKIETYMGLVKVIPTGVTSAGGTSATLSADGTVTVGAGNTSVRIDGAFSSAYDNYKLIYADGVGSTALDLRLQFGVGSTLTATNYNGGRGFINVGGGTWQLSADNNATSFACGGAGTAYAQICLDILQPNFAGPTLAFGMYSRIDNGQVGSCWTHQNNPTAFTSVSIATSTGTISGGQIRIYGYRN